MSVRPVVYIPTRVAYQVPTVGELHHRLEVAGWRRVMGRFYHDDYGGVTVPDDGKDPDYPLHLRRLVEDIARQTGHDAGFVAGWLLGRVR